MTISLIRTLLLYVMIIAAVRIMGKRQISELQTSELVVTLLISDIAAIPMQNTGQPLSSGIIPILVLVSCEIAASFFMVKNSRFRKLVAGKPQVVINNGTVDQAQMKRLRMSTEDLSEQLRQMNVFSIQDVAYAIVETNGKLSVMKKPEKDQVSASMLGIAVPDHGIDAVVIRKEAVNVKRIWVAVCAMVLMITLCVIELSFTNSSIDRLTEKLDQAEQKVHDQDYSTAFRLSEEALEVWNSDHKVLSFYTTHDQLEQIDLSFAVLLLHLQQGNYDDFLAEKYKAAAQLENVKDNEMPSLHNLF